MYQFAAVAVFMFAGQVDERLVFERAGRSGSEGIGDADAGRCDVMVNVMCDRGNGQGGVVLRDRCVCSILIGIINQHFC